MAIDWTELWKKYQGLWVALQDDEKTVVATGRSVKEVMDQAKRAGHQSPILFNVPSKIIRIVGAF